MPDRRKSLLNPAPALIALLLGGLLVRLAIAIGLPPGFDEAYYYLYTLNPSLSYFDHPPLVALTTGLGPWLTGQVSQLTIRLGPVILYTGTLWLLYLTSKKLFSHRAGLLTVAVASIAPTFQVGFGVLTLPDNSLMFFWMVSLYFAALEFFARPGTYQPSYRLAIIGLMVGLACVGKYHGFILGLGLVGFCLTSPRHRAALTSRWTLLGVGLFLLALSPVLVWNFQHDWGSFWFQSARAVPETGYRFDRLLITFLAGVGYLFPPIGLGLWWVSGQALLRQLRSLGLKLRRFWPSFSRGPKQGLQIHSRRSADTLLKQRLILWVSLPLILGFTLISGYQQVLPTWPMPGFFAATLLLGDQVARWQEKFPQQIRRWLWGSGLFCAMVLLLALLQVSAGILQKPGHSLLSIWPVQADSSTQLVDIEQLRQGFQASPVLGTALQKADFVFTNRYFLGGQIAMAIAPLGAQNIACFDADPRGFAFWFDSKEWLGKDALYITSELFQSQETETVQQKYGSYFQSLTKLGEIPIRRSGVEVQTFIVYQAQTLLKPYPLPYGQ